MLISWKPESRPESHVKAVASCSVNRLSTGEFLSQLLSQPRLHREEPNSAELCLTQNGHNNVDKE